MGRQRPGRTDLSRHYAVLQPRGRATPARLGASLYNCLKPGVAEIKKRGLANGVGRTWVGNI